MKKESEQASEPNHYYHTYAYQYTYSPHSPGARAEVTKLVTKWARLQPYARKSAITGISGGGRHVASRQPNQCRAEPPAGLGTDLDGADERVLLLGLVRHYLPLATSCYSSTYLFLFAWSNHYGRTQLTAHYSTPAAAYCVRPAYEYTPYVTKVPLPGRMDPRPTGDGDHRDRRTGAAVTVSTRVSEN